MAFIEPWPCRHVVPLASIDWAGAMRDAQRLAEENNLRFLAGKPAPQEPKPVPQWTRERPTVPGWYWWRYNDGAVHEPNIVEVKVGTRGPYVQGADIGCLRDRFAEGAEWSGPLEPPP